MTATAMAASGSAAAAAVPGAVAQATAPPGYTRVVRSPLDNPALSKSAGIATCPAHKVMWGGGTANLDGDPPAVTLHSTSPHGSAAWRGSISNVSGTDSKFEVVAVCAAKPARYRIVSKAFANPPSTESHATVTCPANIVVLSGGVETTSTSVDTGVTNAWPRSNSQFVAWVSNGSVVNATDHVLAVCAARPPGYSLKSLSVSNPGATEDSIGQACPINTSVIGGGASSSIKTPAFTLFALAPGSRTVWDTDITNSGATAAIVTSYVICARERP